MICVDGGRVVGRSWAVTLPVVLFLTLSIGCSGSGSSDDATATAPDPTASPTPERDIRDVAITSQPEIVEFLTSAGGEPDVRYADLTGDGRDEAIVSIKSGGESGDIAVFVFGYVDGNEPEQLLRAQPADTGMTLSVVDEQLVTEEGTFAPGDPFGVPSLILRRYYVWDGEALVIEREEEVPAR